MPTERGGSLDRLPGLFVLYVVVIVTGLVLFVTVGVAKL
jgi:hypothetical protein